jgi:hypothetical protein
MGKGKGALAGRLTRVRPGSILLAFSQLRPGHLVKLLRQFRVRCPLQLGIKLPEKIFSKRPFWLRIRKARRRYARLANARGWLKTRKYKQQRIFEYVTLIFF